MDKTQLVFLVACILTLDTSLGASKTSNGERSVPEYGPPIRISSSVLTFQRGEETHRPPKAGKYISNGEWEGFFDEDDDSEVITASGRSDGYLKFVGVIGSGHVYVPDESADRVVKPNDGLLRVPHW